MVRTRFAPSPTGYMHIGNLRTALYEYLIAKALGGRFVLRIEDTDTDRYVEGATDVIYSSLRIAGIMHDEGPDVGGAYGPYVQSQRLEIYRKHADSLIERGMAYPCFCTKQRLEALKSEDAYAKYDKHCENIEISLAKARMSVEPHVVRQRIPPGETTIVDEVFGEISFDNAELEHQVLIKADGYPTYNFANVVDDHLMKITHVVRGTEYLSSAPKYTLLYRAFGWDVPKYVHLPPVLGEGGAKLSKRKGDASFQDLMDMGFLPEAVLNYVALLGWSPGGEREIFSLQELEDSFSIAGLSKAPAAFDIVKLTWMNSEYFKKMEPGLFAKLAAPYVEAAVKSLEAPGILAGMVQTRIEFLKDIPSLLSFIDTLDEYDTALYEHKKMKTTYAGALYVLRKLAPVLEKLPEWGLAQIREALEGIVLGEGLKNGQVFWPLRVALSGRASSPCGAPELAEILGRSESIKRILIGIARLEVSSNEQARGIL